MIRFTYVYIFQKRPVSVFQENRRERIVKGEAASIRKPYGNPADALSRQVEENRITQRGASTKWWTWSCLPRRREGKRGGRGEKAVGNGQCEGRRRRATLSRMRNNANLNGSHDGHPFLYERKNKTETGEGWMVSFDANRNW